ncbi:MAG TPA: TfuA-like protein [Acetobacteraceae bacterium]|nr:TfuA-like protein [Acetobacteraceae bacterium]
MTADGPLVVFAGPTLTAAEVQAVLPALCLPPARQGDLWRAVQAHAPRAIGLIDGVFLHVPAVWHREILWALSRGVHVFGAASMGALRAAELDAFGMRGVGRIYEAYRDGRWPGFEEPFLDDDEVAVIHAPAEAGGAALSDAMVDLRDTLLAAETAGMIDRAARDRLAAAMKALPFADRSLARLQATARAILPPEAAARLEAWLPAGRVQRKRLDALAMLEAMAAFLRDAPPPHRPAFRFQRALVWERFVTGAGLDTPDDPVLEELWLQPDAWRDVVRAALGRLHARRSAPATAAGSHRPAFDRLRQCAGLATRAELEAWLRANRLDGAALARLLHEEMALDAVLAARPAGLDAAILNELRLSGRYAALRARAGAKQAALGPVRAPEGPTMQAALDWYFGAAQDCSVIASTAAVLPGPWPDEAAFRTAVWREYLFASRQGSDAA